MAPLNSKVLEKLCQRQTLSQNRLNKFHIVKFNSIINSVEIKVSLSKQHGVFTRNLNSTVNGEPECRYAKVYRGVALEALLRALDSAYYRVCHRVKNQKKLFFSSAQRVSPASCVDIQSILVIQFVCKFSPDHHQCQVFKAKMKTFFWLGRNQGRSTKMMIWFILLMIKGKVPKLVSSYRILVNWKPFRIHQTKLGSVWSALLCKLLFLRVCLAMSSWKFL